MISLWVKLNSLGIKCIESVVLTGMFLEKRGEGVALVLSGSAVNMWTVGGRQWKAWSSRVISVWLWGME